MAEHQFDTTGWKPVEGHLAPKDYGRPTVADDIVNRLREEALRPAIRGVCNDAADEIERLRTQASAIFAYAVHKPTCYLVRIRYAACRWCTCGLGGSATAGIATNSQVFPVGCDALPEWIYNVHVDEPIPVVPPTSSSYRPSEHSDG